MTYNMIPYRATFYQLDGLSYSLLLSTWYHSTVPVSLIASKINFFFLNLILNFFCQMYRGSLADGSLVAIRCLKLKKKQASINFKNQIDIISKLRHRHLTSALGHCFEYYLDDSTVSRIFFIFEFAPNGNLRSNISRKLNSISYLS